MRRTDSETKPVLIAVEMRASIPRLAASTMARGTVNPMDGGAAKLQIERGCGGYRVRRAGRDQRCGHPACAMTRSPTCSVRPVNTDHLFTAVMQLDRVVAALALRPSPRSSRRSLERSGFCEMLGRTPRFPRNLRFFAASVPVPSDQLKRRLDIREHCSAVERISFS